jgi:D-3-phosphoglycerate dehydrogenase
MKIKAKVLLMFPMMHEVGFQRLKNEVEKVVLVKELDAEKLLSEVEDATVLNVGYPSEERGKVRDMTTKLIERGAKLKAIAGPFVSDLIDFNAASAHHLAFLYPQSMGHTVAEHCILLMLSVARRVQYLAQEFREGRFSYGERLRRAGTELDGKTVGIVGLGGIGSSLARKCRLGFNNRVLAYDPYVEQRIADNLGVELVEKLSHLLKESDFVCMVAKCTDESRHMIGRKELRQMKPSSYIINTTPGLIDERALIEALQSGTIAGAGLDVFEPDPPDPENPLLKLQNVAITPHMAGMTEEVSRRQSENTAEEIITFLRGGTPQRIYWP